MTCYLSKIWNNFESFLSLFNYYERSRSAYTFKQYKACLRDMEEAGEIGIEKMFDYLDQPRYKSDWGIAATLINRLHWYEEHVYQRFLSIFLRTALDSRIMQRRRFAVQRLTQIRHLRLNKYSSWKSSLFPLLLDEEPQIQMDILIFFGADRDIIPFLALLLYDPDLNIQRISLEMLERIASSDALFLVNQWENKVK